MLAATRESRSALSLVEVLVVIGVMGLLVGLTLSAVQSARGSAARVGCANHLRQLGLAATSYHDANGTLPQPYVTMWKSPGYHGASLPWTNLLLPYLEQESLWGTLREAYQAAVGYVNPPHAGLATVVKVYTCPADGRLSAPISDDWGFTAAYGSYLGVVDSRERPTAMDWWGIRITEVTDGTSQTLLIGERPPPGRALSGNWYTMYRPSPSFTMSTGLHHGLSMRVYIDHNSGQCWGPFQFGPGRIENPCDSYHYWSLHSGGAHFLYVDGSVHFLKYSAAAILPALASRAGGEVVPDLP